MDENKKDVIRRYYIKRMARLRKRINEETDLLRKYYLIRAFYSTKKSLMGLLTLDNQRVTIKPEDITEDGGPGSGNHGHKGVPGQQGGSAPKGGKKNLVGANSKGLAGKSKLLLM